jgi:hypothetical protein
MMPPPYDSLVLHGESIIAAQFMKVNRKDGVRRESRAKGHAGISRQERTLFLAAAIVAYHGERNERGRC